MIDRMVVLLHSYKEVQKREGFEGKDEFCFGHVELEMAMRYPV